MDPRPTTAAHGHKGAAWQALADKLNTRAEWSDLGVVVDGDKVMKKLRDLSKQIVAGKFKPKSGFGGEDLIELERLAKLLVGDAQEAADKKKSETEATKWDGLIKVLTGKWGNASASGKYPAVRLQLAMKHLAVLAKVKQGSWAPDGTPLLPPQVAWDEANDRPLYLTLDEILAVAPESREPEKKRTALSSRSNSPSNLEGTLVDVLRGFLAPPPPPCDSCDPCSPTSTAQVCRHLFW